MINSVFLLIHPAHVEKDQKMRGPFLNLNEIKKFGSGRHPIGRNKLITNVGRQKMRWLGEVAGDQTQHLLASLGRQYPTLIFNSLLTYLINGSFLKNAFMENILLVKLKSSLTDTIQRWLDQESGTEEWNALDTHVSDFLPELMADSAFNILLAQSDLTTYYQDNEMLK